VLEPDQLPLKLCVKHHDFMLKTSARDPHLPKTTMLYGMLMFTFLLLAQAFSG